MQTPDKTEKKEDLMLGIIGGTSLLFSEMPVSEKRVVATPYGPAEVHCGEVVLLLRHQNNRPPHRINYRACLSALALCGAERIIAVGSVGSLKKEIAPGSMMIPSDYLSMTDIPSIHDHAIDHVMPEIDPALMVEMEKLIPEAHPGGVYAQTRGPRIETVAEVETLARIADVVGMTIASEATLSKELAIPFAAICMVDNYAHGINTEVLSYEHILACARENKARTEEIIRRITEKYT